MTLCNTHCTLTFCWLIAFVNNYRSLTKTLLEPIAHHIDWKYTTKQLDPSQEPICYSLKHRTFDRIHTYTVIRWFHYRYWDRLPVDLTFTITHGRFTRQVRARLYRETLLKPGGKVGEAIVMCFGWGERLVNARCLDLSWHSDPFGGKSAYHFKKLLSWSFWRKRRIIRRKC